jgi:dextranase
VTELLPTKASFTIGDDADVELRGLETRTTVVLWRLGEEVARVEVAPGDPFARFGRLPPGGYGVETTSGDATALDVLSVPGERLRYGFVSDYAHGRSVEGVADNLRRLHLNAVQFYDWMYRHADLVPPTDEFADALGRRVSLPSVKALVSAVRAAGSLPLGYAAVYAIGEEAREEWGGEELLHPDGTSWSLADFLWIVDPSSEPWLTHVVAQLRHATAEVGFAGFHLDQYGAPKRATRRDGARVDLARAFPSLIDHVRAALGDAFLVFNNVNDFPTATTAAAAQDATYIEVWSPHDELSHLGDLITKARALAPRRPVVLAAYLSAYAPGDDGALEAMRLELATAFSHGATCLLFGEGDAILTDPYYVRHAELDDRSASTAKMYLDFAVRYGDILFDPTNVDVTRTHLGGINEEVHVLGTEVATDCRPAAVWARVVEGSTRRFVSLIDLRVQSDVRWDAPKAPAVPAEGLSIAFERQPGVAYFFATPEMPRAQELHAATSDLEHIVALPSFRTWAIVWADHDSPA